MTTESKLQVKLTKSVIGRPEKHRKIVTSLGLRRMNHTVLHVNTPLIRGMLHKVSHLVEVEVVAQ